MHRLEILAAVRPPHQRHRRRNAHAANRRRIAARHKLGHPIQRHLRQRISEMIGVQALQLGIEKIHHQSRLPAVLAPARRQSPRKGLRQQRRGPQVHSHMRVKVGARKILHPVINKPRSAIHQ